MYRTGDDNAKWNKSEEESKILNGFTREYRETQQRVDQNQANYSCWHLTEKLISTKDTGLGGEWEGEKEPNETW